MFLDTSNIEDINKCMKAGIFKGVTTNPTILLKENKSRMEQINDILKTEAQLLFVQIVGDTVEELYKDYELLKAIATDKKIGYKVSIDMVGLEVVRKIKEDNKDAIILGTAIYSAEQAILAALAGCDYVAPYVNRMENNNIDPYKEIEVMRKFYDTRSLSCEILAASFKNTTQVTKALLAGAHTCTIPADIFMSMINKEVATAAIKTFNDHGEQLTTLKD